ncbi:unnamed protein product [Macrosiphum euphorbiae]|uniref:Peptidase C19 ubiquitin carboxyl-terminal hydrolase domain-containing protein n=1 Tax=Macrosiphum euphorbiae TaxID=13131 RepID=A0AAV0XLP0_9HEMI|nr:unnamed protein product [Macrosiphum euphorbiae]
MRGRKPSVPHQVIIDAVILFKDRVIATDNDGVKHVVVGTNDVWMDISMHLNGRISKNALHLFVHNGRHGVKEALGLLPAIVQENTNQMKIPDELYCQTDSDLTDDSDNPDFLPKKKHFISVYIFTIRMAANTASRSSWTPLLAEHFWEHTNLPCCISFKRAKVFTEGNVYICVIGRCSICCSHFKGFVKEKPSGNSSSEVGHLIEVQLCDIPQVLIYKDLTYELRGVVNYRRGNSKLRTSVGHYNAYCKRSGKQWELIDDLKKKAVSSKENTKVICEFVIYSI